MTPRQIYPLAPLLAVLAVSCVGAGEPGPDCRGPVSTQEAADCRARQAPNECTVEHTTPEVAEVDVPPYCAGEDRWSCEDWGNVRCTCNDPEIGWTCTVWDCTFWTCVDDG